MKLTRRSLFGLLTMLPFVGQSKFTLRYADNFSLEPPINTLVLFGQDRIYLYGKPTPPVYKWSKLKDWRVFP